MQHSRPMPVSPSKSDSTASLNGWDSKGPGLGIHQLHIEQISVLYPQLTAVEVRIAAYIRGGLATVDIADMIGLEGSTVENYRVCIRRKLGLRQNQPLQHYLSNLQHAAALASLTEATHSF